jgi:hypothetical protein
MLALKGRYDGTAVVFDRKTQIPADEVIVTFLDFPAPQGAVDDGSLAYLFRDYTDDSIREPPIVLVSFPDSKIFLPVYS